MSNLRFKPSLWPSLAAVAGIALTLALGNWQLGRGNEKSALAERRLAANCAALIALPVAEILHGAASYHVLMQLRIDDGARYDPVDRGWVEGEPTRATGCLGYRPRLRR